MPHSFFAYISQFTLKSIIIAISYLAFDIFKNSSDNLQMFAKIKSYNFISNGVRYKGSVSLYQTNLIDVMYEVINYGYYGQKDITLQEALYLIHLHVNLDGLKFPVPKNHTDFMLSLFGNLGEQKRFQSLSNFLDDFCREKYILETVSKKEHSKNNILFDFQKEFFEETSLSTDVYSSLMFVLFGYFSNLSPVLNPKALTSELNHPELSNNKIIDMAKFHSASIDEIRKSEFKRQIFYQKPIIEIEEEYIAANPILLLSAFANSNFWVIRNKYANANKDTRKFTKIFGKYFEIYLEEVLENCLSLEQFENIPETNKEKRADWHLKIGNYDFLVEQKSTISFLEAKQSHPNVEKMKKYICETWGKAVEQLDKTQKIKKIDNAIKIILVYEDYFDSLCLDELFDLNQTLVNDKNYWLVSISDFERLLYTYKTCTDKFFKIIEEKIEAEKTSSNEGRELSKFLIENGITHNEYLKKYGIADEFQKIETYISYGETNKEAGESNA